MSKTEITISAVISAPVSKVWDYYTNPKHIVNWNFASDDWQCPEANNDLKKGGKYSARMEAKDGSYGFDFEAIYKEVIVEEKLHFTLFDEREVFVTFKNLDDQTEVTTVFDAETQNPIDMQRDGWQAILNNFKKYVES